MHQWGENIPILRKANPQSLQQFAESFFFSVSYPCVIEISFSSFTQMLYVLYRYL